jgi:hypothetical protein
LQSGGDFPAGDLFCKEKCGGLGSQAVDQRRARSMVDRPARPAMELPRAWPSGRSGPRQLLARWGNDEELVGVRFWSSPKTERRRGGGAVRGWTVASGAHLRHAMAKEGVTPWF